MKAVIQRVTAASVSVDGNEISKIGEGLFILLGVSEEDTESDAEILAKKTADLRIFEDENGKRYHHIFDPSTGYLADSGLISVTVLADNGCASDALSTACFVLGIEKSLPLLEEYGAEAIFITDDNKIITTLSDGDSATLKLTNETYNLGELK
jgi:thiamine biosynthesis lipoprotein